MFRLLPSSFNLFSQLNYQVSHSTQPFYLPTHPYTCLTLSQPHFLFLKLLIPPCRLHISLRFLSILIQLMTSPVSSPFWYLAFSHERPDLPLICISQMLEKLLFDSGQLNWENCLQHKGYTKMDFSFSLAGKLNCSDLLHSFQQYQQFVKVISKDRKLECTARQPLPLTELMKHVVSLQLTGRGRSATSGYRLCTKYR